MEEEVKRVCKCFFFFDLLCLLLEDRTPETLMTVLIFTEVPDWVCTRQSMFTHIFLMLVTTQ